MAKAPVVIVPWDPSWPGQFEEERGLLAGVFRGTPVVIEHIGSTAVRGLGAKPIIDIMLGAAALSEVEVRIGELGAVGYEYVPEYEAELPERRYFRKPAGEPRTRHLHCVVEGSLFWRRQLAFRDHLRAHPEAAAAYEELKRRLAARYGADRMAYTEAKTGFIESILARA